ncbi:hypothetical protein F4818DRAFT_306297 [Hypoxylon cercidicola]|nr:hypothetical protein F4818DRAFT_306297 [Hypoxylon cercidicola]
MAGENRGPELLAIIWVFTVLAVITVGLKLLTRAHMLHALGWDDFFIFFSAILIIICTSIFTYDVHLGMGRHASDLPVEKLGYTVMINFIGNPFGIMAYSFPNISVAILLERLMAPNKWRAIGLYTLTILQCVIAGISCVLLFVQCTPSEYLWNPIVPAHCFPPGTMSRYSYFVGSFTAFTDIVLAIVPIASFWNLQLPKKTKVSLCLVMGCTLFAAICAIVKTTYLNELEDLDDFTYGTVDLIIWAIVEANVIIIAACMPTLRPLFSRVFKKQPVSEGQSFFRKPGAIFGFAFSSTKSLLRSKQKSGGSRPDQYMELSVPEASKSSNDSKPTIWRTIDTSVTYDSQGNVVEAIV